MTYFLIFCVILALTSAQLSSQRSFIPKRFDKTSRNVGESLKKGETIIENKNVNIIVNVDPKEVAQELWKVIDAHLNKNSYRRSMIEQDSTKELEKIIRSLLMPTRRGIPAPSAFKVAYDFEQIARRAVSMDSSDHNMLDKEILVRDIVADLMVSLRKMIIAKDPYTEEPWNHERVNRRMLHEFEKDDYINIRVKLRRSDLINAFY